MANLSESATYDAGVYQLETVDPVVGGAAGVSNAPLKNLANRTAYLKSRVDNLESGSTVPAGVAVLNSPAFTGNPTAPTSALGDADTSLATTAFVQSTVGGVLTKSVAGSANVTLTAVEAGNAILVLTGALTGNIAVIVPTAPTRGWVVKNATSGAFTVTVKTAAGTGVVCTQGYNAGVWTDGTNVYDALTDFDDVILTGNPQAPTAAPADNDTTLATTAFVTAATDGMATVSVAGGVDVTLTSAQYGLAILNLTGAITANINLVFPSGVTGNWVVANNSSGSFNITGKTSVGTGVVVPQGSAMLLYGDGTNIYAASAAGQASMKSQTFTPASGTTSLTVLNGYTPGGLFLEKNGSILVPTTDYTATNGSIITLATASLAGDTFVAYAFAAFTVANAVQKSGDTMTGSLAMSSAAINEAQGENIASATSINLTTASGNYAHITGTTAITAITLNQGAERTVVFDGILTLTHGASLILPSWASITTAAGDTAVFRGEAAGLVRCIAYTRASTGRALAADGLGYGQTWQNVTGSRALATTYYNTTGKPIYVNLSNCYSSSGVATYTLTIGGQTASVCNPWNTNTYGEVNGVVPPGASYAVTTSGSATGYLWSELS